MVRRVLAVLILALGATAAGVSPSFAQPEVFRVALEPSGDADGSGVAVLRIDPDADRVCYTIVVRDIAMPMEPAPGVGSAHIHGPLAATGIAINLLTSFEATGGTTFIAKDCISASGAAIDAVLAEPERFYVNIHNAEHPSGAIEGNLGG